MKKSNFFWVGYSDLMTSMFFIMLVLFFVTVRQLYNRVGVLEKEKEILETVQKNVEKLKDNEELFAYDSKFKRYTLKFEVQFKSNKCQINDFEMLHFNETEQKLKDTGAELKKIIDNLAELKKNDKRYQNISYMIVVAGSASRIGEEDNNYSLSYLRAYNLYKFWRENMKIDFDAPKYHNLVEFQIAGNGTGGVGRIEPNNGSYTRKNQRFIINVIPKLGEM
jgi:outer membrane protein OmpA-like peptidoglycan-associated protein